jgi:hypothetical protein
MDKFTRNLDELVDELNAITDEALAIKFTINYQKLLRVNP